MDGRVVYATVIGICVGIAVGFLWSAHIAVLAGACIMLSLALLCAGKKAPLFCFMVAAALAAAAFGLARTDVFLQHEAARDVSRFDTHATVVEGWVVNDPERRETTLHVHIEVEKVGGAEAHGKALVFMSRDEQVRYGDYVQVRGRLEKPESFETDTGRVFDYPSYLRAKHVSAVMYYPVLVEVQPAGMSIRGSLYALKHSFTQSLGRIFNEPQNALLGGLLLGERRALPERLTDAFIVAGLIHIVVLSGYNISIIADAALRALSFLPRAAALGFGGAAMALFVLMIGGGATAMRALLMGLIAILARYFGRTALALRALAVAAAAMVLWNPSVLLFDPSFVLSVLATFGLVTLSPAIEERLPQFLSRVPQLKSIAASTIAVQLYVLPALLYMSGVLSFVALPANVLALPAVPFAMGFGFLSGILGYLHPLLALSFAIPTDVLLRFIIAVAEYSAALPFSSAVIEQFSLWLAFAAYVPLTALAIWLYSQTAVQ